MSPLSVNKWVFITLLASGLDTEALAVCRLLKVESVLLCLLLLIIITVPVVCLT